METSDQTSPQSTHELLDLLSHLEELSTATSHDGAPHRALAEEFFRNNWEQAEQGLLARTELIRVEPGARPAPRTFRFQLAIPYLRQPAEDGPLERADGPLGGTILYRPDLMIAPPGEPVVQVLLDDPALIHPNYFRSRGIFCLGVLPPGPIDLEMLLELSYMFLTFQSYSLADPADIEAARLVAANPEAVAGLGVPAPLY